MFNALDMISKNDTALQVLGIFEQQAKEQEWSRERYHNGLRALIIQMIVAIPELRTYIEERARAVELV